MLAAKAPRPERLGPYLTQSLARLYVTARTAENFDQYVGLDDNSLTELIGRALFAANRQGRVVSTPIGARAHPARGWREPVTETVLDVEVATTRRAMDVLQLLAAHSPNRVSRWTLARITGQTAGSLVVQIADLRKILRAGGQLDIPPTKGGSGWSLTVTEPGGSS